MGEPPILEEPRIELPESIQGSQFNVNFRQTGNNFLPDVFAWDFLKLKCHSLFIQNVNVLGVLCFR